MGALFPTLAVDNALAPDEGALLAVLPDYDTVRWLDDSEHAAARRLERRGLIKVHRWKDDPVSDIRTWYAGRTDAGRAALASPADREG